MSKKRPLVSVVMGVYNGEKYLRESIESILNQTFTDFEFIIIDDGSIDSSKEIISSYDDKRIRFVSHENRGLVAALNEGIGMAKGMYIARQDDDDISLPNRFEVEVAMLENDTELVAVGSSILVTNELNQQTAEHHLLLKDREIRDELLIRSPFAHGSMMLDTEAVKKAGLYQKKYWPAEDYDLWVRLAGLGKTANIDEPLYKYRVNSQGISAQNESAQLEKKQLISEEAAIAFKYQPLKRKELSAMVKNYATKPTFFYRKRLELLISNYLQLSQKISIFEAVTYGIRLLSCPGIYIYAVKVALNRVK